MFDAWYFWNVACCVGRIFAHQCGGCIDYDTDWCCLSKKKLDKEPVVTVDASVISKREKPIYRRENSSAKNNMIVRIIYYATFRTKEQKEIELSVTKEEWDLLAEGDEGELTYQGNWYQEFEKNRKKESLSRRLLDEIES